jgi:hypothetical protein
MQCVWQIIGMQSPPVFIQELPTAVFFQVKIGVLNIHLIQVSHLFYLNELQVNKKNVFLLTK